MSEVQFLTFFLPQVLSFRTLQSLQLYCLSVSLSGHTVRLFGTRRVDGHKVGGAPLSLPKIRKNPFVEIIAINTG